MHARGPQRDERTVDVAGGHVELKASDSSTGERLDGPCGELDARAERGDRREDLVRGDLACRVRDLDERALVAELLRRHGDELTREPRAVGGHDLADRSVLGDATVVEQRHGVADLADHGHLVRDDQDRDAEAVTQVADQPEDLAGRRRVERRRGFVAQEHRRLGRERASDPDALPLPAGQLRGVGAGAIAQPDQVEQLGDACGPGGAGNPRDLERVGDVAGDGPGVEQIDVLEDEPDAAPRGPQARLGERRQLLAVDHDAARRRALEHGQAPDERRLPGARAAHDPVDLARLHAHVDAVERNDVAARTGVDLAQADDLDAGCGAHEAPCGWQQTTGRHVGSRRRGTAQGREIRWAETRLRQAPQGRGALSSTAVADGRAAHSARDDIARRTTGAQAGHG